ncbi:uncharacterized protein LOC143610398 [Bidens hawaiensis]|uniref:uncharacterized protein LOC143610398 n=1 Tax=Bidens hawaiensis TaxID=980011 RepID=UPI00404978ED
MAMIGIVPEVYTEENYEFWKICLKSYLVGQGLWEVVSREAASEEEEESPDWKRKNAQALHAIQLACGSQAYSKYKKNTHVSAKFAWDHLAEMGASSSQHSEVKHDDQRDATGDQEHLPYESLYNAIEEYEIELVKDILKKDLKATTAFISSHKDTPLHIAILSGKVKIALVLVNEMLPEGLEISNQFGATPLSLAAITDDITLAKAMVEKNHKLVTIKRGNSDQNSLPVIVASMYGRKRMVHYLYSKTPKELLDGSDGVLLLNNLITAEFYDIASMLLHHFPKLGIMADHHGEYALHKLAHNPSAFASGSTFSFWKHWIYKCVRIHSPWDIDTTPNASQSDEEEFFNRPASLRHWLGWILLRFLGMENGLCTNT